MKNTKYKNVLFVLLGNLAVFISVELLCGLLIFAIPANKYSLEYSNKDNYQKLIGPFAPHQDIVLQYSVPYRISINSLGLRGKETTIKKTEGVRRILTVGDSVTLGFCISNEGDTFSRVLESQIKNNVSEKYEVINCGIGGTSIRGQYQFIKDKLLKLKPDVIVLTFCSNDISDLSTPKGTYEELEEYITNNKTPLFKRTNTYKFIHRLYLAYLVKSKVLGRPKDFNFSVENRVDFDVKEVVDGFEKAFKNDDMIIFERPLDDKTKKLWKTYEDYLYKLDALLDKNNVKLVMSVVPAVPQMFFPDTYGVEPQKRLKKMSEKLGIGYLDYLPSFLKDSKKKYLCCLPYDFHPSVYGHRVMGEVLYRYLLNIKVL